MPPRNPDQIPKNVFDMMSRFHQRRSILIENLACGLLIPIFLLINAWMLNDALNGQLSWYESILYIGLICSSLNGLIFIPNLLLDISELKLLDLAMRAEGYRPLWLDMPPIRMSAAIKHQMGAGLAAIALCAIGTLVPGNVGLLLKLTGLVGFIATGTMIGLHNRA